uniref:Putative transposase (Putative), gypsy type n=1 Tax=Helianthus annuus TaxID=4232 RepID=A0A251SD94_HELAN
MSEKNPTQKKRKHRGKAPPGPDQAVIGWKEKEFQNLVRGMNFRPEWGAQYPPPGSTALDAPPGYITLYAAFFREGSFRLPITKFTAAVLRGYGLHVSQINAIGLPRITHFEYVCRAYRLEPTFEMFNVFYSVTYTSGFYSFQARTGVASVCSVPLKSLHDWKQKFFYIRRGVIPIEMPYRHVSQGIPKVDYMQDYAAQDWYKKITSKATAISQLDEMALVGAGMSLLWVPKHPLGQPVYSHQGKCTAQGDAAEPVHEVVGDDDDVEVPVDPSTQLESRKKARTDRSGRREGKPESKAAGSSRKRPSTHPCLGYLVVSDTLSGLGVGEKSQQSDPDDSATLTEHMKKKALEDHKRKLDEQSAALLAAKKAKLQKEAPPAPSESEIDLGVFSGGRGNLLEEMFAASAPPSVVKTGKKSRFVDISQITPPASPPSRTVGLTPPRDDDDVGTRGVEGFTEGVVEGGDGGGGDAAEGGGADRGKGIEVEMESSETTPQQTIYTKRPPGGGGATSGVVRSPHFERNPADSWGNPACDDLPHAPRWGLT